jgi:lipopolysaccharide export system permease protein
MKTLERYILRENFKPFVVSLVVVTFVFLLDKLIDLLNLIVEKRLDITAIVSVFSLSLPFMLALSVPMAVLVATIMSFGRLSVDNELVAFKSCGINIYTLMRSTVIAAFFLSLFMVYFNTEVLPNTNHQLKNLLIRLHYRRPVTSITPGQFTSIKNYTIYASDIKGDELQGIVIYHREKTNFPKTITARRGELFLTDGGNNFKTILYEGEIHERDDRDPDKYTVQKFSQLTIHLPDLGYQLDIEDSEHRSDREMTSRQMKEINGTRREEIAQSQNEISRLRARSEAIENKPIAPFPEEERELERNNNLISMAQNKIQDLEQRIREFQVEIQKKYAIAVACLIFVILGVPIGMMIRTSGVGVAFSASSVIFVLYYICLVSGEHLGDNGHVSPALAMWAPNILFGLIGLYLVIISTRDLKTLNIEEWMPKLKKIFDRIMQKKPVR